MVQTSDKLEPVQAMESSPFIGGDEDGVGVSIGVAKAEIETALGRKFTDEEVKAMTAALERLKLGSKTARGQGRVVSVDADAMGVDSYELADNEMLRGRML
ncbi:hypothetical protein YB2330_003600 [Saitoella coloradoensis]